jgi:hypothetical protein
MQQQRRRNGYCSQEAVLTCFRNPSRINLTPFIIITGCYACLLAAALYSLSLSPLHTISAANFGVPLA